jgi:uncharacterized protein YlaN (UPF0358 family)
MDNTDSNIEVLQTQVDEEVSSLNTTMHSLSRDWVGLAKQVEDVEAMAKQGMSALHAVEKDMADVHKRFNEQTTILAHVSGFRLMC